MRHVLPAVVLALLVAACGGEDPAASVPAPSQCADVVGVDVAAEPGPTYRFDVTVRSADTGWDKYADAWEIRAPDGTVLGTRVLTHPHVDEQPFTRSLSGVAIPPEVTEVEVLARDIVEGFCGTTRRVAMPR